MHLILDLGICLGVIHILDVGMCPGVLLILDSDLSIEQGRSKCECKTCTCTKFIAESESVHRCKTYY